MTISQIQGQTKVFSHLNVLAEAGVIYPRQELKQHFNRQVTAAVKLESPYYGHWKCHATLQYSLLDYLKTKRDVHEIKAGIGLVLHTRAYYVPGFGLELGNYSFKNTGKHPESKTLLDEFESEFGIGPIILWELPLNQRVGLRLSTVWDIVFSQPRMSHFFNVLVGLRWSWW